MSELEKKLEKAQELKRDLDEAQRVVMLKGGQLEDVLKDVFQNHLGIDKDKKEVHLPDLLMQAFKKGKLEV
jgi:hypothetical protein